MRFEPDIIDRIIQELEKVPNIRHVCNKVGVHHSTFYRWMASHDAFRRKVVLALTTGRELISDGAEAVLIKGVQDGNQGAAKFWLSHNNLRYMSKELAAYRSSTQQHEMRSLMEDEKPTSDDFEEIFRVFLQVEENYDMETARGIFGPLVNIFCRKEEELVEIFYATYEKWKLDQKTIRSDEDYLSRFKPED